MAGDWIKMRGNLWDDPRVASLCDITSCGEATVIGGLYWLWATADQHTEDGILPGLSLRAIDRKTGIPGFGNAMVSIGWLADHPEGVRIIRFDEHNGASAKKRCQTAKRVANFKAGNAEVTQPALPETHNSVSGALPREREREVNPLQELPSTTTLSTPPVDNSSSLSLDSTERAKTLAAMLNAAEQRRGKKASAYAAHPKIKAWVAAGVTDPQFREAYDMALTQREESGELASAINVGFLDAFVAKLVNPPDNPSAVSPARPWHESAAGIEAKGRELDIPPPDPLTGGFPAFKARVFQAAGIGAIA